jgi:K+ transporter
MLAFATVATIIASQAIISGAYYLTQRMMQLVGRCCLLQPSIVAQH